MSTVIDVLTVRVKSKKYLNCFEFTRPCESILTKLSSFLKTESFLGSTNLIPAGLLSSFVVGTPASTLEPASAAGGGSSKA